MTHPPQMQSSTNRRQLGTNRGNVVRSVRIRPVIASPTKIGVQKSGLRKPLANMRKQCLRIIFEQIMACVRKAECLCLGEPPFPFIEKRSCEAPVLFTPAQQHAMCLELLQSLFHANQGFVTAMAGMQRNIEHELMDGDSSCPVGVGIQIAVPNSRRHHLRIDDRHG